MADMGRGGGEEGGRAGGGQGWLTLGGGEEGGRAGGGQGWLTSLIHISVSSRLLAGCLAAGLLIRPINFLGPEMCIYVYIYMYTVDKYLEKSSR